MKVYVVMGNDFPAAVFSTLEKSEIFCDEKRKEDKMRKDQGLGPPVYWRVYEFEME
jgi:hypothetical protein